VRPGPGLKDEVRRGRGGWARRAAAGAPALTKGRIDIGAA
jgi:hypothetical protein